MSDKYDNKTPDPEIEALAKKMFNGGGCSELNPLHGSTVNPRTGVAMEDLRHFAKEVPVLENRKMVRVSDGYWVLLEDGYPKLILPHGKLFE